MPQQRIRRCTSPERTAYTHMLPKHVYLHDAPSARAAQRSRGRHSSKQPLWHFYDLPQSAVSADTARQPARRGAARFQAGSAPSAVKEYHAECAMERVRRQCSAGGTEKESARCARRRAAVVYEAAKQHLPRASLLQPLRYCAVRRYSCCCLPLPMRHCCVPPPRV